MVQLPAELVTRLDERAEAAGVSRSQLIRDAITDYLRAGADREAPRPTGTPTPTPDVRWTRPTRGAT